MEHIALIIFIIIYGIVDRIVTYLRNKDIADELAFLRWQQEGISNRVAVLESKLPPS